MWQRSAETALNPGVLGLQLEYLCLISDTTCAFSLYVNRFFRVGQQTSVHVVK